MDIIKKAFDDIAQEYDKAREFVIPDMQQFYGSAVWAAQSLASPPTILDIGAGTGLMSALVLQKFPDAPITLMGFSENMLEVARERFKGQEKIRYVIADYSTADLSGPYDIICSALSIHHLTSEDKQLLFQRIFIALQPGGMFLNADLAEGETAYFSNRYKEYWTQYLECGPLNNPEHREQYKKRGELDRPERLSDQLRWLTESGFSDVDVVYKNRGFAVTVGRK